MVLKREMAKMVKFFHYVLNNGAFQHFYLRQFSEKCEISKSSVNLFTFQIFLLSGCFLCLSPPLSPPPALRSPPLVFLCFDQLQARVEIGSKLNLARQPFTPDTRSNRITHTHTHTHSSHTQTESLTLQVISLIDILLKCPDAIILI